MQWRQNQMDGQGDRQAAPPSLCDLAKVRAICLQGGEDKIRPPLLV